MKAKKILYYRDGKPDQRWGENTSDISIWPLDTTERDKESRREADWRRLPFHFPFKPVTDVSPSVAFSRYTRGTDMDTRSRVEWTAATVILRVCPSPRRAGRARVKV